MKLKFILPNGPSKISNDFYVEYENRDAILQDFCDFLKDNKLFWNSETKYSDDIITITWFKYPADLQEKINDVGDWFGMKIDNFDKWDII